MRGVVDIDSLRREPYRPRAERETAPTRGRRSGRRRRSRHGRSRRRRIWIWTSVGVFGLIVAVAGVTVALFAREALAVRDDLVAARAELLAVPALIAERDADGVEAAGERALQLTTRAEQTVEGPLWDMAGSVPLVGANVEAVQSATQAIQLLVRDALPAGAHLLRTLDLESLAVEGGGIDLEPLVQVQESLPQINEALAAASQTLDGVDRSSLHEAVAAPLDELDTLIDGVAPALGDVERNLPTVLGLLGAGGPREYMILFQNNAEVRSTGGNPGAFAVVAVDNGRITMRDDEATAAVQLLGTSGTHHADLPQSTLDLYESDFARFSQNYTRTPHFPTTAAMFGGLWRAETGTELAGVLSVDPPLLGRVLAVTGPVALADGGEISADNAVSLLLHDVYQRFGSDGPAADAYFKDVAARVFDAFAAGDWDPLAMLEALEGGVDEDRVHAWFADESEQQLARDLGIDGELSADNSETTQLGVFVNDAAYSKLDYFLEQSVEVACDPGARAITARVTLTNHAPESGLSDYILTDRGARLGLPLTTMIHDVMLFAPPGAEITGSDPASSDFSGWDRSGAEEGHPVKSVSVAVPRGESRTVSFTVSLPDDATTPLDLRYSPTVGETSVEVGDGCVLADG